jgi:cell division protein FtsA
MSKETVLAGLDIGSSHIRLVVAQLQADGTPQVLAATSTPSEGIHKGVVTSLEDAVTSINIAIEQAERISGVAVENVMVSFSGHQVNIQKSNGVVAVGKADGEIVESDVERVLQNAQTVSIPPNYEIINVIPLGYHVDDQIGIKDPIGMAGVRLRADVLLVEVLSNQLKNLSKAVYRAGVNIDNIVLSALAAGEACLDKRQKELGVAVINMGAATTGVAVYQEGDLLHVGVVPVGSGHITSDIAIGLRIAIDVAEQIKLNQGTALPDILSKRDEVILSDYDPAERERVPRKQVAEIIQARLEEIFSLVRTELDNANIGSHIPAGIVLTGGGSQLPGLVDAAKSWFSLPVSITPPIRISSITESVYNPAFSTAAGLILWAARDVVRPESGISTSQSFGTVAQKAQSVVQWLKNLLP